MSYLPKVLPGLLLGFVFMCSACSSGEVVEALESVVERQDFEEVALENQTGEVLFYLALELEMSHLVDPQPSFSEEDVPLPRLETGTSAIVEDIDGYEKGDDVRFLIYTFDATDSGEVVVQFTKVLTVTHEALLEEGGRVVVRDL